MNNLNPQEIAEKIMEEIKKEIKGLDTLNVMVLGKTGVGKSTLINNMFNEELAETGIGKPITTNIRKITKPDFPLAIYDTPGLELSGEFEVSNLLNDVVSEIESGSKYGKINDAIHCILYCVSTPSHRIEQTEINFLQELSLRTKNFSVPVILVLTKSYSKKDAIALIKEIEKENLPIVNIVPILAENFDIDEEFSVLSYGLDRLSQIMNNVIPEAVQKAFIAVQKVNLEHKKNKARTIVTASSVTAAATGVAPIPFSDAALLVPNQITMLAGITAVFGLPLEKAMLTSIVSATLGTAGATIMGKSAVANILKFIPGAGTVVGGAISGATAAALTAALGEAYINIMILIIKGELKVKDLDTPNGKQIISDLFKKQLKLKRNNTGELME